MDKAILEFNISDSYGKRELEMATKAQSVFSLLYEIDQQCRNWQKHGHKFNNTDELLTEIRSMISEENLLELYI